MFYCTTLFPKKTKSNQTCFPSDGREKGKVLTPSHVAMSYTLHVKNKEKKKKSVFLPPTLLDKVNHMFYYV